MNTYLNEFINDGFFSYIIVCLCLFVVFGLILIIMKYIFEGIGLMKMAKNKNEKYPWLSWIPYAKQYLKGKLAYNTSSGGTLFLCASIVLELFSVFLGIIFNIGMRENSYDFISTFAILIFIVAIIKIGYLVYYYITMYKIYKQFSDKSAIMLVLSIFFGDYLASIFIFAIRNNKINEVKKVNEIHVQNQVQ